MKKWLQRVSKAVLAGALALTSLGSVIQAEEAKPFDGEKVKVGVVGDNGYEVWSYVADKAKEQEGIDIEVVLLTDYNTPNEALADGSLDLNSFQHIAFLNNWNESNDQDLQPIGFTSINPMGIYTDKLKSIDEIKDGDTISIPNDPTNGGRALLTLELAGLIEVDDAAGILPTIKDITANPKNLVINELDAAQVARSLPDVAAACINVGHAADAGLSLEDDTIFKDSDAGDELNDDYKNIIVCRNEDMDSELFKKIVELYQTDDVAELIVKSSNGGSIPIWD